MVRRVRAVPAVGKRAHTHTMPNTRRRFDVAIPKLNPSAVRERYGNMTPDEVLREVEHLQTAIFVAAGGGMIGRMYAEQPADAYRDSRAGHGRYPAGAVANMQQVLCIAAAVAGLDPHHLPRQVQWHNCGVF